MNCEKQKFRFKLTRKITSFNYEIIIIVMVTQKYTNNKDISCLHYIICKTNLLICIKINLNMCICVCCVSH